MATTKKTKTSAKSKVVSTTAQRNDLLINKKIISIIKAYKTRQIAALKKKLIVPGIINGGKTLDLIKKDFEALIPLLKKFPKWTTGIPQIDNLWSQLNNNVEILRLKDSKTITNNKIILGEIEILEDSQFITEAIDRVTTQFRAKKITSAATIKTTAVETIVKDVVKKKMNAMKL